MRRRARSEACSPHRVVGAALLLVVAVGMGACERETVPPQFAARVGAAYLTESELRDALVLLPVGADSAEAREQLIEEWVTTQVLSQEARRRGLQDSPEVERVLRDNEQSILIAALIDELLAEPGGVAASEARAYFETNQDRLTLREPFVRVRYLRNPVRDSVQAARDALQRAIRQNKVDSLWPSITRRFAEDAAASQALATQFVPVSQLFATVPSLAERTRVMGANELAPVLEADSAFHLVQLVARVEEGAIPEYTWVEAEVRQRVAVQQRKQSVARQVRRLRTEAEARGALVIPPAPTAPPASPPRALPDSVAPTDSATVPTG